TLSISQKKFAWSGVKYFLQRKTIIKVFQYKSLQRSFMQLTM
ncbi:MAG: hypothetical protein ACI90V_007985, partial [Bacillariaceae sp.]